MTTPAAPLATQPQPIDLSAGLVPKAGQNAVDLSAGLVPKDEQEMAPGGSGALNNFAQSAANSFTSDLGIPRDWSMKNMIATAKQKWADAQAGKSEEEQMANAVIDHIKKGNYGQAAEALLGHIAKTVSPGVAPAMDIGGNVAEGVKSVAQGRFGEAAGHVGAAGMKVLPFALGGAAGEAGEGLEGAEAAEGAATKGPGIIKQALGGREVAQAPAKAAIRTATGASEETPLLAGNKTAADEALGAISAKEKAAYKVQDEAAGFDVKETRAKLKDAEWKVKQPEIDDATRERLTKTIDESKKAIGEAEKKMGEAGVDPKAADTLFKQRKAGEDFRKALVQHVSADGESVNVDGLINAGKKLRNTPKGDRLEQFMGKEGADRFMKELQQAQEMGAHALKVQRVAKIIGGTVGVGAAGELMHAIR